MTRQKLFFGTGNPKKLKEIDEILGDSFEILSFKDLPSPLDVEETEDTLQGNARLKAVAFFEATGIPCFSDDTGLEVNALNGAPGVYSARYAGPANDAIANQQKLLAALTDKTDRSAKFRTVIALYDGHALKFFEGELRGHISHAPRGHMGFGYDPIFVPEGETRCLAEMQPEEKNAISHRGLAVQKLAEYLRQQ